MLVSTRWWRVTDFFLQMSSCASFKSMNPANHRPLRGVVVTGVGGVMCSRHEMWRPNAMVNLQKGER
jgi:hypothetical protein